MNVVQQVVNGEWWISGSVTMEVLNEGCSLGLLVPAATVSCSSSAYRLCNCYYFFLSLTLFFYSPLCDFSILHAYVPVNVFNFCNLLKRLRQNRKAVSRATWKEQISQAVQTYRVPIRIECDRRGEELTWMLTWRIKDVNVNMNVDVNVDVKN